VCGPGIATGVSTGYCCASGTVGVPDAATADSEADSSTSEADSGTTETDTGTTDGTDEVGSCSLGVNTGTPACDSCLEANCCSAIVACDAPDDAGLTGGYTACENLYLCINACMLGNPDAGVPGDTPAACEETCQIDYNDTETQNAVAFVTCQTTTCATACQ
jgi:hypothetical protein